MLTITGFIMLLSVTDACYKVTYVMGARNDVMHFRLFVEFFVLSD